MLAVRYQAGFDASTAILPTCVFGLELETLRPDPEKVLQELR
jgi:hypothetical protein